MELVRKFQVDLMQENELRYRREHASADMFRRCVLNSVRKGALQCETDLAAAFIVGCYRYDAQAFLPEELRT